MAWRIRRYCPMYSTLAPVALPLSTNDHHHLIVGTIPGIVDLIKPQYFPPLCSCQNQRPQPCHGHHSFVYASLAAFMTEPLLISGARLPALASRADTYFGQAVIMSPTGECQLRTKDLKGRCFPDLQSKQLPFWRLGACPPSTSTALNPVCWLHN